jgi:hypothetical protein
VRLGQPRHLLDERAGAAVDPVAKEPADRQHHLDRPARDGEIRQLAAVSAVHPGRHPTAPPTPRPPRPRMRGDHHPAADPVDPVDHHRRQMRKQNPAAALISHKTESTTPSRPESRPLQGSPRLHGKWDRTTYRDQRHRLVLRRFTGNLRHHGLAAARNIRRRFSRHTVRKGWRHALPTNTRLQRLLVGTSALGIYLGRAKTPANGGQLWVDLDDHDHATAVSNTVAPTRRVRTTGRVGGHGLVLSVLVRFGPAGSGGGQDPLWMP